MSGWRLEKKSQTAYRFKKKEGRALVALLSFLCNRNEVSYYAKNTTRAELIISARAVSGNLRFLFQISCYSLCMEMMFIS